MKQTLRMLCAWATSVVLLLSADASALRPISFSTDHLGEFMGQGPAPAPPQDSATSGYRINFVKSEPQNNLRKGRATKAVVEVRDRNNKPVAGAVVLFLLPNSGPSGTFAAGGQSLSLVTNSAGQAVANYTPNQLGGIFNLTANAQVNGIQVASTTVTQANIAAAAGAAAGGMSGATIGVIAGVAAAAAVGIGVGMAGGGGSSPGSPVVTPPTAPSIRIGGGGAPVFGPRSINFAGGSN
jgi:hypothetical protein